MADHAERVTFGAGHGTLTLLTGRDGLAATAGHDLTIEICQWSAQLELAADGPGAGEPDATGPVGPAGLTVTADLNSLAVRSGTGGVLPLTDRDRREIAANARRVLKADRHPSAVFTATGFEPAGDGGGSITGILDLAGASRPFRLDVSRTGTGRGSYHAAGSVRQSDFGIRPYTAFLGALRVSDAVRVAVDVTLPRDRP